MSIASCASALRRRDDHALARGEPVGLDDDRRAVLVDVGVRRGGVAEGLVERGGNVVAHHEALGEILGGFELRRGPGRAEDLQARGAECVDHAGGQRRFRARPRSCVDVFALGEIDQLGNGA